MPTQTMKESIEEKRKEEKKLIEKPAALKLKKKVIEDEFDSQMIEIKKLTISDLDDVVTIMRKAMFEITPSIKGEIKKILGMGYSYGAYFERLPIAVALAWPIPFDAERKKIEGESPNAMYIEDIAILIAYEGKGIREKLIKEIEKRAIADGYNYVVSIVGDNPVDDNIVEMIENRGSKAERTLLSLGYKFVKSPDGLLAFKEIG